METPGIGAALPSAWHPCPDPRPFYHPTGPLPTVWSSLVLTANRHMHSHASPMGTPHPRIPLNTSTDPLPTWYPCPDPVLPTCWWVQLKFAGYRVFTTPPRTPGLGMIQTLTPQQQTASGTWAVAHGPAPLVLSPSLTSLMLVPPRSCFLRHTPFPLSGWRLKTPTHSSRWHWYPHLLL